MQCSKYPDRVAAGVCAYSGKPYSAEELVEVQGKMYAKDNLGYVMAEMKERAGNANPMVFMNAGGGGGSAASASSAAAAAAASPTIQPRIGTRSKATAIILALLLGGIGAHKFYLGQTMMGFIYLLFCWTFIPSIVAFIEAFRYLFMSKDEFSRRYG